MAESHQYSTRVEAFFAKDIGGVPLAVILCGLAALALATVVALTAKM